MIRLPQHPLPPKPRMEEPCNGCGLCCHVVLCEAAKIAFPDGVAPCPALTFKDGRTFCGLVLVEAAAGLEPILRRSLGIGHGCSMSDDQESLVWDVVRSEGQ